MLISVTFQPEDVLGVSTSASLQELRAAYHEKARKHHPDHQGDSWAFRVVNQAFEMLCRKRISARVEEEESKPSKAAQTGEKPSQAAAAQSDDERVMGGIKDPVYPSKVVDVELLFIRLEISDPTQFLFTAAADRNLSCTMTLSWPSQLASQQAIDPNVRKERVELLQKFIKTLVRDTHPQGHVTQATNEQLMSWLTYPTAQAATQAFRQFRQSLLPAEMGVNQRTRELIVDRPAH